MLCQKCKQKEASYYYKETINGVTKSTALCADCAAVAKKNGELAPASPFFEEGNLFGDVGSLFTALFSPQQKRVAKPEQVKKCTLCGATFPELMREGKVGCPDCYAMFAEELSSTIGRIHGSVHHTGRAPKKFRDKRDHTAKLAALKQQLGEAIRTEAYEDAARIRDEIRALESADGQN